VCLSAQCSVALAVKSTGSRLDFGRRFSWCNPDRFTAPIVILASFLFWGYPGQATADLLEAGNCLHGRKAAVYSCKASTPVDALNLPRMKRGQRK